MNLREKRTHKYLQERNFLTWTVTKPSRKGMNHDIFGLWDHIAVIKDKSQETECKIGEEVHKYGDVIFIQTKSRKQYGKDLDKYRKFPAKHKYIFAWIKNLNGRYKLEIQKL